MGHQLRSWANRVQVFGQHCTGSYRGSISDMERLQRFHSGQEWQQNPSRPKRLACAWLVHPLYVGTIRALY